MLYKNLRDWSIYDIDGICPTLTAAMGGGGGHVPMIIDDDMFKKDKDGKED